MAIFTRSDQVIDNHIMANDGEQALPKKLWADGKTVLRLPDPDQAKSAVLNRLSFRDAWIPPRN